MNAQITGLHHVTAMTSDAQENIDFYAGILGLRMVKKTINFDAPEGYHLYYGNEIGTPGTILTFFPIPGLANGRKGNGQLTVTSFSIPENAIGYWLKRLEKFRIPFKQPQERFGSEEFIYFEDVNGLGIELVANKIDNRTGYTKGHIAEEYALKGFYNITMSEEGYERTAGLLSEQLDHSLITEKGNRFRFSASGEPGDFVDVVCNPESQRGLKGSGTVHHVAFATPDDATQSKIREKLITARHVNVTPVLDRKYFHSIYFREPGGVLFEVATIPPGFAIDEPIEKLGQSLQLPSWEETNRIEIEKHLTPVQFNIDKFRD